jgi:hypothetical protein
MPLYRPPCTSRAVTLFDMFQVIGIGGGAWLGIQTGSRDFGVAGAVVGGIVGLVAGQALGLAPWYLFWVVIRLHDKMTSTQRLREKLRTEYPFADRLIAEMVVRGEPVESFWPYVLSLLNSDSFFERAAGWENLNIWFPGIAKQIEGYNPQDPATICRRYVMKVEHIEPSAAPLLR